MSAKCINHPEREPVGACIECGHPVCMECRAFLGGKIYCTPCADKKFVYKNRDTESTLKEKSATKSSAGTTQQIVERGKSSSAELKKDISPEQTPREGERKKSKGWLIAILIILGIIIVAIIIAYIALTSMGYQIEVTL